MRSTPPGEDESLSTAAEMLRLARRVAVLTGAGVSAESGVPTFRASDGLWEGHRIEDVATPQGFRQDPKLVWRFYGLRRANLRAVTPNPGHAALVQLEQRFGDDFTLATQNVDGLHSAAGSKRVLELHGNIRRVRCTACDYKADRGLDELGESPPCPSCGQLLRPDIVWFHEMLPEDVWVKAAEASATCDCFLVVGTSAVVYPAAGLVGAAKSAGAGVIEVNPVRSAAAALADVHLQGPSGRMLPELLKHLG